MHAVTRLNQRFSKEDLKANENELNKLKRYILKG